MQFAEGDFYHVYNRGNNKQPVFIQERNYQYFIEKTKQYIQPNSNLLAYCLMPNHFHFLVQANSDTVKLIKKTPIEINTLTEAIRLMLSSYTRAIQKQESTSGSLFQQKTKCKCVNGYLASAFHYIHQNPYRAGIVNKMEDYQWSSMREYAGLDAQSVCRKQIAWQYLGFERERFLTDSYGVIPDDVIREIEG